MTGVGTPVGEDAEAALGGGRCAYQGAPGAFSHEACMALRPWDEAVAYDSFEAALAALKSGEVGCAWGAGLKQGPEAAKRVLAFETRAAQDGGWVMFQDGTIRGVTAEEFAAAPKATP